METQTQNTTETQNIDALIEERCKGMTVEQMSILIDAYNDGYDQGRIDCSQHHEYSTKLSRKTEEHLFFAEGYKFGFREQVKKEL